MPIALDGIRTCVCVCVCVCVSLTRVCACLCSTCVRERDRRPFGTKATFFCHLLTLTAQRRSAQYRSPTKKRTGTRTEENQFRHLHLWQIDACKTNFIKITIFEDSMHCSFSHIEENICPSRESAQSVLTAKYRKTLCRTASKKFILATNQRTPLRNVGRGIEGR